MLTYYRPPRHRLLGQDYYKRLLATGPSGYWPLWDNAGAQAQGLILSAASENLVSNPTFEALHGIETFAGWRDRAGTGAIADEGTIVHAGSHAAKLTRGDDDNLWISQDLKVVPGDTLSLSFWARGDGSVAGRYCLYDLINAGWIVAFTTTGVTAAAYSEVTASPTVPAGCTRLRLYLAGPTEAGSVYFDDCTLTGTGSLHGSYAPSGVTLAQPGIGDGKAAASFSGAATCVLLGSNRFNAVWDGDLGSAIVWGKMSTAQWADTAEHRYLFHAKSANDPHAYIVFGKQNVAKTLFWRRKQADGKDTNEQTYAFGTGPVTWFCMGYCWDTTTPRLRGYLYVPGSLPFTEVFSMAGGDMDAWSTNPVNDYNTALMAGSTEAQEWTGLGAHACYWGGRTLSKAEMQHVMVL
jgi:hypothetical protein